MHLRQRRVSARTTVCAATAGAVVSYAVLAVLPWTAAWAGSLSLLASGAAVVALGVLALLGRQDGRLPWLWLSGGLFLAVVVRTAAAAQVGTGGPVLPAGVYAQVPWLALAVLAGHVLVLAGLHRLVLSTTTGLLRGAWLDLLLAACVVAAVVAQVLGPWLAEHGIGAVGGLALFGRLALVLTMALLTWSAVAVRGRDRDARLEVLGAAAATFLLAEVTGLLVLTGALSASPLALGVVGAGRLVAVCLFAVAALSAPGTRADVAPPVRGVRVVMAAVLSTACALLAVDHVSWLPALPDSAWLLAVAVLLIGGVRMTVVTGEVAQLLDERRQAVTDALTGLHSRQGLRLALDHHREGTLLLLDLDGFKEVNDRCGQAVGDEVLRVVADRLRRCATGPRVVARLGADEFALLLLGADAAAAGQRAVAAVTPPITVGDRQVRVSASAGLAAMEPGTSTEEALRRADVAMQQAKRSGGGLRLFDEALDAGARHRERLLDDLRALLDAPAGQGGAGQVVAHYQPQVDADGSVSGVEALVRWEHPELGLLQPVAFIDLAEEHGLLPELTERVLRQAVTETARWRAQGHDLRVAVNLSASCLDWPRLLDVVDDVLGSRLVPAGALVLEVTETGLVSDAAHGLEVAAQLVERGVELSIDDYGTGYSSLAHLNHLPARELKLDRAFTRRLLEDGRTATIVRATIDLAHALGMRLVAEGVEDDATLQAVTAIGCDVTQGYWHSRPLPASELTGWLRQRSRQAVTRA